jgi:hypothetical protein
MKRIERLKWLKEREQWTEGDKVFGLPKIKTVRIKMKKEKGAEKAAEGAAAPAAAKGQLQPEKLLLLPRKKRRNRITLRVLHMRYTKATLQVAFVYTNHACRSRLFFNRYPGFPRFPVVPFRRDDPA